METPKPILSIDKISLTIDVPEDQQVNLHYALMGDGTQQALARVANFWDGECYHPTAPMGYKRAVVLKRGDETFHMAFAPYRFVSRLLTPSEALSRRLLSDPFAQMDPERDFDVSEQRSINFLRVEFNPSKFPDGDDLIRKLVNSFVLPGRARRPNTWEAWRSHIAPTRIDVATDYPVRKENFDLFLKRKRKSATFSTGGEVETTYYGRSSGNQIRCYDKRKEQLSKLAKDLDKDMLARATAEMTEQPITRVEAQIRDLRTEEGKRIRTASDLRRLVNPYAALEVYQTMAEGRILKIIDDGSDWQDVAIASMISIFGLQETLKRMPRKTAYRYRQRWTTDGTPIVHPQEVFNASFQQVSREVLPCLFS